MWNKSYWWLERYYCYILDDLVDGDVVVYFAWDSRYEYVMMKPIVDRTDYGHTVEKMIDQYTLYIAIFKYIECRTVQVIQEKA